MIPQYEKGRNKELEVILLSMLQLKGLGHQIKSKYAFGKELVKKETQEMLQHFMT